MISPPLWYFYVLLMGGVIFFFYMLMADCVPMVLKEWGEPVKAYWKNRNRGELEEVEKK
jgi:hypothetical protein